MEFLIKMQVYTKVPRSKAIRKGHKIISTTLLDVNKGDSSHPDYRSRLAGKEINTEARLELFAAAQPLESLKIICALCALNQSGPDPYVIMSNQEYVKKTERSFNVWKAYASQGEERLYAISVINLAIVIYKCMAFFTMTGIANQLEWPRLKFCQKYEMKPNMIERRIGLEKDARVFNRTIKSTNQAVEY